MSEREHGGWLPGAGSVLDIGDGVGALVLYTDARFLDWEIEISLLEDETRRVHTAIHERRVGDVVLYAGVYPDLAEGQYRLWTDDPSLPDRVTIVGGQVSEVDWRTPLG